MTTPATSPVPPEQEPSVDLAADPTVPAIDTSPLEDASALDLTTTALSTQDTTALESSTLDPAASQAPATAAAVPPPAAGTAVPPPPAGPSVPSQAPGGAAFPPPPAFPLPQVGQPYQTPPPPSGTPTYTSDPGAGGFPPPYAGPAGGADPHHAGGTMPWQAPRPRQGRMIAGVCAGLARRYNLSPTAVRLLFVVSTLLPGPQFIAYIVLWALMPEE